MGVARGFRQAVAGDTAQREFDGCLETHAMTDGDVERLHSGARAHYRPDGLCAIDQQRPCPFHVWRFVMMAGEPGLGRPDGGDIQEIRGPIDFVKRMGRRPYGISLLVPMESLCSSGI